MSKIRLNLTKKIDQIINTILNNLADYYPQAPPTGGTHRMRQAVI
jgi:hypothetical protein